jgi:hypothetical protein
MSTWTWDPGLQWWLDYFSMVAHIPTWDHGSPTYFSIMVHTYPWDPGIWLYTLITSIEDNTFIRGMECSVAREVMGGGGGRCNGSRAHSDNSGGHSM